MKALYHLWAINLTLNRLKVIKRVPMTSIFIPVVKILFYFRVLGPVGKAPKKLLYFNGAPGETRTPTSFG
jgi:hypothetical protein